jgi:hypothetical protein
MRQGGMLVGGCIYAIFQGFVCHGKNYVSYIGEGAQLCMGKVELLKCYEARHRSEWSRKISFSHRRYEYGQNAPRIGATKTEYYCYNRR